ncbi:MAG: HAD family hydrolase, partial [Chloroflexi bacterium]|nr:HAD family hydrolase [Chloroflexota bacterium]
EAAVNGHVLVYVHKELETEDIRTRYPAAHYVMLDDKPRIHAALKTRLGDLITTVMVSQGQYAHDTSSHYTPEPDIVLDSIGDVASLTPEQLRAAAQSTSGE